jgi:predicted transcriptional regulator
VADRHKRNPVRIRAEQHDRLAELAGETGRTVPELLADAISDYCQRHLSPQAPPSAGRNLSPSAR